MNLPVAIGTPQSLAVRVATWLLGGLLLLLTLSACSSTATGEATAPSDVAADEVDPATPESPATPEPPATPTPEATATTGPTATPVPAAVEAAPRPTAEPGADQIVAIDTSVTEGVLDNGVRYLIRSNDSPGLSAEFRLVVDAGSAVETNEQLGAAHLLEHMMFNGTEEYPGNELISRLEALGTSFGADINAYTSYDETVYSLSVRSRFDSMRQALEILEQWAGHALLLDEDIDDERGVVSSEWRSRRAGVQGRALAFIERALLDDTVYENRSPIASEHAIRSIDPEQIRSFYDDWYRPDLMTVVAVGDFDPAVVEEMIREEFAGLEARSDSPPRVREPFEVRTDLQVEVFQDEELTTSFAEVVFPGPARPLASPQDNAEWIRLQMALSQIQVRMQDRIVSGDIPGAQVYSANDSFVAASSIEGIGISASAENFEEVLEALFEEIERMRRFGSTEQETELSREQFRAAAQTRIDSEATKQDNAYARDLVAYATTGNALLATATSDQDELIILDRLTADDVTAGFQAFVAERPPSILIFGADDDEFLPDADRVADLWRSAQADPVDRYEAPAEAPDALMDPPEPVSSTSSQIDAGATELSFDNGATVVLFPTRIALDVVHFAAVSPGGDSVIAPEDVKPLALIAWVAQTSGLGPHDPSTVSAILRDDVVDVSIGVSFEGEEFFGGSSTGDMEDLMAATHLLMTSPRVDAVAVDRVDLALRATLEDPSISPSRAIDAAWVDTRYGGDERFQLITLEALDGISEDHLELFDERFNNPADFTFIFVGDFEIDMATDLAQRYIGTLEPRIVDGAEGNVAAAREEAVWDLIPEPPAGVVERTVEAGQSDQGTLVIRYAQDAPGLEGDPVSIDLLREVLGAMVRDEFRERLGATYAPSVNVRYEHDDEARIRTEIFIEANPPDLQLIQDGVTELIATIAADGVPVEAYEAADSILTERYRFVSNEAWLHEFRANALIGRSVLRPSQRQQLLRAQTVESLNAFAAAILSAEQYIAIQQIPLPDS